MHVFRNRPDEPHCTRQGYFCFAPEQAAEGVKAGPEMDETERIKLGSVPAGTASGSARETLQYLLEPADASAAEPSARVLFGIKDLERLQKQRLNPEFLHEQARSTLNAKILNFRQNNSAQAEYHSVTTQEWLTWKEYIASLPRLVAAGIVGSTGVIAIGFEQIEGTKDGNRGGDLRVDIVLQNADGEYWRLHPGNRRRDDAKPRVFKKCIAPGLPNVPSISPASQTYRSATGVFTRDDAEIIPQIDRFGRREMFRKLQNLPASRPLELTQTALENFPWRLWISNISDLRDEVIGAGIERIALMQTSAESSGCVTMARFLIVHADKTALLLTATPKVYSVEHLQSNSDDYNWWVNWTA